MQNIQPSFASLEVPSSNGWKSQGEGSYGPNGCHNTRGTVGVCGTGIRDDASDLGDGARHCGRVDNWWAVGCTGAKWYDGRHWWWHKDGWWARSVDKRSWWWLDIGESARAVSDGKSGGCSDSVDQAVEGELRGRRADSGQGSHNRSGSGAISKLGDGAGCKGQKCECVLHLNSD